MASELRCKSCKECSFEEYPNGVNRYYCSHPKADKIQPHRLICKTERRSKEFSRKNTPRWCPQKIEKNK